ncbi:MAG: RIP metalloprotease RseP [bacterium]|nr:RIP metalloprotease RseP [bacterium]
MLLNIFGWFYGFAETFFWAVLVLGVLVFIHELGHFWVAKKLGIGATVFSLGFGKRIWGFQRGETDYRVSLIPLGGYVKLMGEEAGHEEEEGIDPKKSFALRPVRERFAVIVAGPMFNILFAVLLSWLLHMAGIPVAGTWVGQVLPNSPAAQTELQPNDRIVAINGVETLKWVKLVEIIRAYPEKRITLRIERQGKFLEVPIVPTSKGPGGKQLGYGRIGISISPRTITDRYNPVSAFGQAVYQNYAIIRLTVMTLYGMLVRTVPADIGGPIRISVVAAEQAKRGMRYLVMFAILLSLNLAILNLLPIPILDGGHIFFLGLEALRGKPMSLRVQEMAMQVGTALLIALMLFATYQDSVYYLFGKPQSTAPAKNTPAAPQPGGAR